MASFEDERQAHPTPLSFTINTRVPSKWRLLDQETGELWKLVEENGKLVAKRACNDAG